MNGKMEKVPNFEKGGHETGKEAEVKEKFLKDFLNNETGEIGDLIDTVKNAPISGSPEHKGAIAVKDEEQRTKSLKELNELKNKIKEDIKFEVMSFSIFSDKKGRDKRYESNNEQLLLIEKTKNNLGGFLPEEMKQQLKRIKKENRVLGGIAEKNFPFPVTEKYPIPPQEPEIEKFIHREK